MQVKRVWAVNITWSQFEVTRVTHNSITFLRPIDSDANTWHHPLKAGSQWLRPRKLPTETRLSGVTEYSLVFQSVEIVMGRHLECTVELEMHTDLGGDIWKEKTTYRHKRRWNDNINRILKWEWDGVCYIYLLAEDWKKWKIAGYILINFRIS